MSKMRMVKPSQRVILAIRSTYKGRLTCLNKRQLARWYNLDEEVINSLTEKSRGQYKILPKICKEHIEEAANKGSRWTDFDVMILLQLRANGCHNHLIANALFRTPTAVARKYSEYVNVINTHPDSQV